VNSQVCVNEIEASTGVVGNGIYNLVCESLHELWLMIITKMKRQNLTCCFEDKNR